MRQDRDRLYSCTMEHVVEVTLPLMCGLRLMQPMQLPHEMMTGRSWCLRVVLPKGAHLAQCNYLGMWPY